MDNNKLKEFCFQLAIDSGFDSDGLSAGFIDGKQQGGIGKSIFWLQYKNNNSTYLKEFNIENITINELLSSIDELQRLYLAANPTPEEHYICGIDPCYFPESGLVLCYIYKSK